MSASTDISTDTRTDADTDSHTLSPIDAYPDAERRPGYASPALVFATALAVGTLSAVIEGHPVHRELPVRSWTGQASRSDRFLLDHCDGSTIDLGCGPGRLAAELRDRGHSVLGVDASPTALAEARRRGVPVVCGSLFDPVPGEGTWDTALLADGNIGIGGDPSDLLARARQLIHDRGRVVVDLAKAGTGLRVHQLHLRAGGLASTSFSWAELGPDALPQAATEAGLTVAVVAHRRGRTVAVLSPATGVKS
ncbi:methyltransferase domain-containing protein [Pedococcus sp. KACC 23699]|uniref:Methyltransferase domain-containing protein n=1 Tax=Pedococcus sp. KACC 23699 TaxID=3149228 RepID=A0AAU7JQI8_9MICO